LFSFDQKYFLGQAKATFDDIETETFDAKITWIS
jgi:hypothetical protein